jgi:hypothetical protein
LPASRARDLVYDAHQHGNPQREDDGLRTRLAVADGDDRTATDLCSQRSRGLNVGAREP